MKTSIFVEQQGDMPAKVQLGTMAVLYQINCDPALMRLSPIVQCAKKAGDLEFGLHICPTFEQSLAFRGQLQVIVIHVLTSYSETFHAQHHKLQYKP